MATIPQPSLFSWKEIDAASDLDRLVLVLSALSLFDEKLSPIGVGSYGRVVRVPLELDRRIFTPIARHTDKWKKAYDRCTSVERVNSRLDQVLGFEHHTIRGKSKMEMRVTLALVAMLAMALGRIRIGQTDRMRSLVAPVVRAA